MIRLTEKIEEGFYVAPNVSSTDVLKYKLGKLEDIEEELGCPLEVVFKALENGIYAKDEDDDILFYYEKVVLDVSGFLHYIECGEMMEGFPLDEYKITWWLKEDKSE